MKKSDRYRFSEIISFDDFQYEKEKLKFEKKLIETRLSIRFSMIKEAFSASNFFSSLAKDILWPKVLAFIADINVKKNTEDNKQG